MQKYTISTTIANTLIEIKVYEESISSAKLEFKINEELDYCEENIPRVAITKWLLKELKGIQEWYSILKIDVFEDDGYGSIRYKAYKKLGFISKERYFEEMIWTK